MGPRLLPGSSLRAGDVLGARYRVDVPTRRTRTSAWFSGVDTKTKTPVAIEILTSEAAEADAVGVRFLSAARRVATLESANVVRVLDAGVTGDGQPYAVSERVHDNTLAVLLASRGSLPTSTAVDLALDLCDALAEAHARGLLHGELSLAHVHASLSGAKAERVKLAGIGTSHAMLPLRDAAELSLRAPEQLDPRKAIDARADVWALGVVLYTLLAGASPFAADSPSGMNLAVALDEPPQLAGVPDELALLVDTCLAKNPALRPTSILRLAEELAMFATRPLEAVARVASLERRAPESTPTVILSHYDALNREKQEAHDDVEPDADSTAPRNAIGRAALRAEGGVDVSDPRLEVIVDLDSERDVNAAATPVVAAAADGSMMPPPVARTVPPPPSPERELPTVLTRKPAREGRWVAPAIGFVAAAAIGVMGAAALQSTRNPTAPAANAMHAPHGEVAPPKAVDPAPPLTTPSALPAASPAGLVAASALPDSRPRPPPPASFARPQPQKRAAAPSARPTETAPPSPPPEATSTAQPEPKTSDDDLRRFLDDRR